MRVCGLFLPVLVLGLGCSGEELPPPRPTTVLIENSTTSSIFVAGDRLPFSILDQGGAPWRADAARAPLCSECDEVCESNMHGDPMPYWLEIQAGDSVSFDWDGRLYAKSQTGCSCGWSCYEAWALQDDTYDLVLEYEPTLPTERAPYTEHDLGGQVHWSGSGLGYAEPRQQKRFSVAIQGQSTVTLTFAK